MDVIVAGIIAYLIGSISFSYIFVKKIKKADIRQLGSGNAGATNTLRVLGKGAAILVLLLDALKGVAAVLIGFAAEIILLHTGLSFFEQYSGWTPAISGLLAILGHNYPVYYQFRGGKGVATTIGVIATLVFFPAIYIGIVAILSIVLTRYVSLGSLIFAFFTPFAVFLTLDHYGYPMSYFFLTCVVGIISIWRHRTNIERLLAGNESKLGQKSK